MKALAPGSVIGILGGGQLGRMLSLAAAELGFDVHVFAPEEDSPAARVSPAHTRAAYDDRAALTAFAQAVDVVTYEFENVPAETAAALIAAGAVVRPGVQALEITQDRLVEKRFFMDHDIAVAPHAPIDAIGDVVGALKSVGGAGILKTRRMGYDGRGQARVSSLADAERAWCDDLGSAPAIIEGLCAFEREVSIIAARGADGRVAFFDLCENKHANGILATTTIPANVSAELETRAQQIAARVLDALDYVGVLAIEFFVMPGQALIANEMAPRVHNSGHWTSDACLTGQFEQHIRAVAGWPLGLTARVADAEMTNLIGGDAHDWPALAADPNAHLHLYGKRDVRDGRKMGHVTRLRSR